MNGVTQENGLTIDFLIIVKQICWGISMGEKGYWWPTELIDAC